jgi:hypothetical protein
MNSERLSGDRRGLDFPAVTADARSTEPLQIAAALGVAVSIVRRLQHRGILVDFDLTNLDVRERLWCAHMQWRRASGRGG